MTTINLFISPQIITSFLRDHVAVPLRNASGINFLREYLRRWKNLKIFNKELKKVFFILVSLNFSYFLLIFFQDQYYVSYNGVPPLLDVGISLFKEIIEKPFRDTLYKNIILLLNPVFSNVVRLSLMISRNVRRMKKLMI
jgi:hypothetical protein